jgi:outer membrane receptor protein involved in Fe transport
VRRLVASLLCVLPGAAVAQTLEVRGEARTVPSSRLSRSELEERLPRSVPEALHYEPGVFVQQTGHGQASPFIRGRTGQQTLLLFDGIRLNNATWRQGPNQYLFTVDAGSLARLEVIRGGASTRYGSDAIGGVVHVRPLEPAVDVDRSAALRPRARLRAGGADHEWSERFQLDAQLDPATQILVGVGFRRLGRLRSGGPVRSPVTGEIPQVPAFEDDGKTMLGTGFRELTADVRAVRAVGRRRVVAAAYLYRQYDAPRTDLCPAPYAPRDECLRYDEQFRTLAYVALEGPLGALSDARLALSYQRQHERRVTDRPSARARLGGRDDVDTFGALATFDLPLAATTTLAGGADAYHDRVASIAWTQFTDLALTRFAPRGQYVAGASYLTTGAFVRVASRPWERLGARAGARAGLVRAWAPADDASGSRPVDATYRAQAAEVALDLRAADWLGLVLSYDRSFRAPNLDDLTSRQQTGPGFQFENPDLRPELADTVELGARLRLAWAQAEAWVFRSWVHDAIARTLRASSDCPPATPQCQASWSRLQLVNLDQPATIDGFEVSIRARPLEPLLLRANLSWAYGRGPNPQRPPSDPTLPYARDVPLSRIAPLHGSAEARLSLPHDVWLGAGLRWAAAQTRLAPSDQSDARIPFGGTPGFAVLDLRAGLRIERRFALTCVVENVGDAAYRVHGSSINGPGRGVRVGLESGF